MKLCHRIFKNTFVSTKDYENFIRQHGKHTCGGAKREALRNLSYITEASKFHVITHFPVIIIFLLCFSFSFCSLAVLVLFSFLFSVLFPCLLSPMYLFLLCFLVVVVFCFFFLFLSLEEYLHVILLLF